MIPQDYRKHQISWASAERSVVLASIQLLSLSHISQKWSTNIYSHRKRTEIFWPVSPGFYHVRTYGAGLSSDEWSHYLQILLSVHRLQVVVGVCVDLQCFSMEQHLNCDEVCEDPLFKRHTAAVMSQTRLIYSLRTTNSVSHFDILQFQPLEVSDAVL